MDTLISTSFDQFQLSPPLMQAVQEIGYETPTPIQVKTIPLLMQGRDVIGQAQTGTGKTAAFALPILQKLDVGEKYVQALVLTPTRELGLQVAEAFHAYGKHLGNVRTLPVYGGQSMQIQLQRLRGGVQIVVGTPGRIMDHLRRGTLKLDRLKVVVLDEADEMLRMGFLALFSATIPKEVRRIADRYLRNPAMVEIEHKTMTVPTTEQRYLLVPEGQKLDALSHMLETQMESGEAALIFARTKVGAAELADKLQARGCAAEAMHGDMNQSQRENVIRRLRSGELEVVVATDVAARGLDVERIGLVVNYDAPYDTESYVHRIGRTGRAGREGKALLFITPRQRRMLQDIERFIGQRIEAVKMPTRSEVAARRIALFKERIIDTLDSEDIDLYLNLVIELSQESGHDLAEIAAAAARMARGDRPLEVNIEPVRPEATLTNEGMVRLFIDIGRQSGVRPGDIVGAIANEADVPGSAIGAIDIYDRFSFVDVQSEYIDQVLNRMSGSIIRSRDLRIRVATPKEKETTRDSRRFKPKGKKTFTKGQKRVRKH
jgi:ATP-dependent RNA helicase DeaD